MPKTVQSVPEPEYGAKIEQERKDAALAATQPAPSVSVVPPEGAGAEAPAGFTVKNPYMLLPPMVNFPQMNRGKTAVEQQYDAGLLWEVLANDPNADPTIRNIARRLLGDETWPT